jgi:hypothetical protein
MRLPAASITMWAVTDVDQLLASEVLTVVGYARSLADSDDGVPILRTRSLSRSARGMVEVERETIDWRLMFPKLTREPGFWERLAALIDPLCQDSLISLDSRSRNVLRF